MRHITFVIVTAFLLRMSPTLLRAGSPDDSPSVLKFSDLMNRPERWPDQVKMKNGLEFTDGSALGRPAQSPPPVVKRTLADSVFAAVRGNGQATGTLTVNHLTPKLVSTTT